jgi:peptidoglycan/LPS O-acetylase OafA/YrhL
LTADQTPKTAALPKTRAQEVSAVESSAIRLTELAALTGIRGWAAAWVMLFHFWWLSGKPPLDVPGTLGQISFSGFFTVGWIGVDIFFTLSAFLLTLPFAAWQLGIAPKPNLGHYFKRRVLRIFPAYYTQLALLLALAMLFDIGRRLNLHEFVAHLFLWLLVGADPVLPLNGVWFTLPIEFSFYLLLPALAYLLGPRRRWLLLIGAIALTWSYRWLILQWTDQLRLAWQVNTIQQLPGRLDQFVIGMLAAYAYVRACAIDRRPSARSLNGLLIVGVFGLIGMACLIALRTDWYWGGGPLLIVWHTCASAFLALILFACAAGASGARRIFASRLLRYLGEISFGVYLWHVPVLQWLEPVWQQPQSVLSRFGLTLLVAVPATILVAHLSYVMIERPALRIGRRRENHPGLESELPAGLTPTDSISPPAQVH